MTNPHAGAGCGVRKSIHLRDSTSVLRGRRGCLSVKLSSVARWGVVLIWVSLFAEYRQISPMCCRAPLVSVAMERSPLVAR